MIFVDTSFWVAVRNQRDAHHREAALLLREHSTSPLMTSNQVRGETWTYLRRRAGHGGAVGYLDALERSPRVEVVVVSSKQEEEAFVGYDVMTNGSIRSWMPPASW